MQLLFCQSLKWLHIGTNQGFQSMQRLPVTALDYYVSINSDAYVSTNASKMTQGTRSPENCLKINKYLTATRSSDSFKLQDISLFHSAAFPSKHIPYTENNRRLPSFRFTVSKHPVKAKANKDMQPPSKTNHPITTFSLRFSFTIRLKTLIAPSRSCCFMYPSNT